MTERIVLRKIAREMTDLEIASVSGGEGTLGDLLRQQGLDPDDYSLGVTKGRGRTTYQTSSPFGRVKWGQTPFKGQQLKIRGALGYLLLPRIWRYLTVNFGELLCVN